jgi:hypothetical protein
MRHGPPAGKTQTGIPPEAETEADCSNPSRASARNILCGRHGCQIQMVLLFSLARNLLILIFMRNLFSTVFVTA